MYYDGVLSNLDIAFGPGRGGVIPYTHNYAAVILQNDVSPRFSGIPFMIGHLSKHFVGFLRKPIF